MKTKTKWLIGAVVLGLVVGGYTMKELVFGFGEVPVSQTKELTREEKQLAYLKEHEQEIIDFVKAQNPKIESVQIDWEDVRRFESSNPFAEQVQNIAVGAKFNNIPKSSLLIEFEITGDKVNLDTIGLPNGFYVGGEPLE